jgi:hypothetical protein
MSSSRLCRLTTRQNALPGETRLGSISVCPKLLSALQPTSPTQLHNIILKYHWIKTSKVNVNLNAERKAESVESHLADVIRDLNASRNDVYFVQCREFRGRRTHEFARSARRAFHARRLMRLTFRLVFLVFRLTLTANGPFTQSEVNLHPPENQGIEHTFEPFLGEDAGHYPIFCRTAQGGIKKKIQTPKYSLHPLFY